MLLIAGCTTNPSLRNVADISVRLYDESEYHLILDGGRQPSRDLTMGSGAVEGMVTGFSDCAIFPDPVASLFIGALCGTFGAVAGGALGAAVGGISGPAPVIDSNPERPATTAGPTISVQKAWHEKLHETLEQGAIGLGKNVVPYPEGQTLHVVAGEFLWDVRLQQEVAMSTSVLVAVGDNGKYDRKQFTLTGPYLSLDDWKADNGVRVRSEVDAFAERISDRVWGIVE
jgi:hypothetical protein